MKQKGLRKVKKLLASIVAVSCVAVSVLSVNAVDYVSHTNDCTTGKHTLSDGGTGYSKLHRYTAKATVTQSTTGGPCTTGGTVYIYYHYRDNNNQLLRTRAVKTLGLDSRTSSSFTATVPSSRSSLSSYDPDNSYAKVRLSTRSDTLKTD